MQLGHGLQRWIHAQTFIGSYSNRVKFVTLLKTVKTGYYTQTFFFGINY